VGEGEKSKVIYQRVMRTVLVFAVALAVIASLFSSKILRYWVGEAYAARGSRILVILAFTNAILALYSILQNTLLGLNKVRFLMKQSLIMAALNLGLLLWLLPKYGILGAAWAYLFSVLPALVAIGFAEHKFFGLEQRLGAYFIQLLKLAAVSVVVSVLYFSFISRFVSNLATLILFGAITFMAFLGLYAIFGFFETEDWEAYKNFLRAVRQKFSWLK